MLVKSMFIKGKYYYHLFQHHYKDLLQQDCLCKELKAELRVKALYHNSKVIELGSKI